MAIELDDLIESLTIHSPIGVEVPRDPNTNGIHEATIERWAKDAVQKINNRRRKTTQLEVVITTEADVQEYDLPTDCRDVVKIDRSRRVDTLDVPIQGQPILGYAGTGRLPSGQEISGSLDLIARQQASRFKREDDWELVGAQIRFLFPTDEGEEVRVTYRVLDRDLDSVPDDHYSLVLTYLLLQNLDFTIGRLGANPVVHGDSLEDTSMAVFYRRRGELDAEWQAGLSAIAPEAD